MQQDREVLREADPKLRVVNENMCERQKTTRQKFDVWTCFNEL